MNIFKDFASFSSFTRHHSATFYHGFGGRSLWFPASNVRFIEGGAVLDRGIYMRFVAYFYAVRRQKHTFERGKTTITMTTRCVVKHPHLAIWGIPKGGLGYEKRGFRASEQGCRGGVLGCRGLRNGGLRPRYTPKIG